MNRLSTFCRVYLETPSGSLLRSPSRDQILRILKNQNKLNIAIAADSDYHLIIQKTQITTLRKIVANGVGLMSAKIRVIEDDYLKARSEEHKVVLQNELSQNSREETKPYHLKF